MQEITPLPCVHARRPHRAPRSSLWAFGLAKKGSLAAAKSSHPAPRCENGCRAQSLWRQIRE
eukprot:359746-Chlamydomonas_euryale.AAC.4